MSDIVLLTLVMIAIAMVVLMAVAAYLGWRVYRSDERRLARRIGKMQFGDKLSLGRSLFADRRVPWWSRAIALALIIYLASPIDLIPDFIPVLGLLDDLLIVLIGAGLLLRSIPPHILEEHVQRYEEKRHRERQRLEGASG